jgi:hypothetical protein
LKKQIKTFEQIYGGYISEEFIHSLRAIAKEAKIRARYNLEELLKNDAPNEAINVCVEAEQYWKLMVDNCNDYLKDITNG